MQKRRISGVVPQGFVDALEGVEVDEHDREELCCALA
jgi:hypothetical protein